MTRAQHRVWNKLRKKQSNHNEVEVVEVSDGSACFFVPFPGLYVTYANNGALLETETIVEREQRGKRLAGHGPPAGEMGSEPVPTKPTFEERYGPWICAGCGKPHKLGEPCPGDLDDDVPF